jgi:hypothetical protein
MVGTCACQRHAQRAVPGTIWSFPKMSGTDTHTRRHGQQQPQQPQPTRATTEHLKTSNIKYVHTIARFIRHTGVRFQRSSMVGVFKSSWFCLEIVFAEQFRKQIRNFASITQQIDVIFRNDSMVKLFGSSVVVPGLCFGQNITLHATTSWFSGCCSETEQQT